MIEAFAAQRADPTLRNGVRPGCPDRGADDADVGAGEHGVERGGELAVSVADKESEPVGPLSEVHQQVAGLLGDPRPGGMGGDPGDVYATAVMLNDDEDVEAAQQDGVDVGEVDGQDGMALGGQELALGRPGSSGRGIDSGAFMIFQTVDAATVWPRPTSSPCTLR